MKETDEIPQIKTGSVVRLKSGGPLMTVGRELKHWVRVGTWWKGKDELQSSGYWECEWITDAGKPQTQKYLIDQLKIEIV